MKKGRIVGSIRPGVHYFWSAWRTDGKAIVLKDDRCRWDVSGEVEAIEKLATKGVIQALVAQAVADGLDGVAAWLCDRSVGPKGRWQVRHDTPLSEIQAALDDWRQS